MLEKIVTQKLLSLLGVASIVALVAALGLTTYLTGRETKVPTEAAQTWTAFPAVPTGFTEITLPGFISGKIWQNPNRQKEYNFSADICRWPYDPNPIYQIKAWRMYFERQSVIAGRYPNDFDNDFVINATVRPAVLDFEKDFGGLVQTSLSAQAGKEAELTPTPTLIPTLTLTPTPIQGQECLANKLLLSVTMHDAWLAANKAAILILEACYTNSVTSGCFGQTIVFGELPSRITPTPTSAPTPTPAECYDSDGGKDYYTKGYADDFGDRRWDVCFDRDTLTEFYCEQAPGQNRPSRASIYYDCPYDCENGVCKGAPPTPECSCTNWQDGNCGDWVCSPEARHRYRTCTPARCDQENQCPFDATCTTTTPTLTPTLTPVPPTNTPIPPTNTPTPTPTVSVCPTIAAPRNVNIQTVRPMAANAFLAFANEADINSDGAIDGADASALVSSWGKSKGETGYNRDADLNDDGKVTAVDASILVSNWSGK